MDADSLVSFILEKKWLGVAVIVIGYLVRLLKDESKFPLSVPPRWRPVIVVGLGQLLAVFLAVQSGVTWTTAIVTGLVVSFFTMGLYDLVVRAIFGDKVPWFIDIFALIFPPKSDDPPKPPKPPTGLGVMMLAFGVGACALLHPAERIIADVSTCLVANQDLPDEQAFLKCGIQEVDKLAAKKVLEEARRETAKHLQAQREVLEARLAAQQCGDGGVYRTPADGGAR